MKIYGIILLVILTAGCSVVSSTLDVSHSPDADYSGPLSELDPMDFVVSPLSDHREDRLNKLKVQLGNLGYSPQALSKKPVEMIFGDGLEAALKQNGHAVNEKGVVRVEGSVNRFMLYKKAKFISKLYTGDVECSFEFYDSRTGQLIYESVYAGKFEKLSKSEGVGARSEVMQKAVDKLIDDFVFDENLVEALQEYYN